MKAIDISPLFEPPYVAVVFTSIRTEAEPGEYAAAAERMDALARRQPGYLGMDHARAGDVGITVAYWRTSEDAAAWKANVEHAEVQRLGRERWYRSYRVRVCRVEREYAFDR